MTSTECGVCGETYEAISVGAREPKLLPCAHTLCLGCCRALRQNMFLQCPECNVKHRIPKGRPKAFPSNQQVLDMLQVTQKAALMGFAAAKPPPVAAQVQAPPPRQPSPPPPPKPEVRKCPEHQKPCVMFCFQVQCGQMLCPSCPMQAHTNHKLVGLQENIHDTLDFQELRQNAASEVESLVQFGQRVSQVRSNIAEEEEATKKGIDDKVDVIIQGIMQQADALKKRVQDQARQEMQRMEGVEASVGQSTQIGGQILQEIDGCPNVQVIQYVEPLKVSLQKYFDFKKTSAQVRGSSINCQSLRFYPGHQQMAQNVIGGLQNAALVVPPAVGMSPAEAQRAARPRQDRGLQPRRVGFPPGHNMQPGGQPDNCQQQ